MRTLLAVAAVLTLTFAACGDSAGPGGPGFLIYGRPYALRAVNGTPLPWSFPEPDSQVNPAMITQGAVTIVNGSHAQREERMLRWVLDGQGDSIPLINAWSQVAPYRREGGTIIITYLLFPPGFPGPSRSAETLYVAGTGRLVLRETGYLPPLDSLVRVYCTTSDC